LRSETLTDADKEIIVEIAVRCVLRYGTGYLNPIERLLPYWKNTSLYERGVVLRKQLFVDHAPKWRVKTELQRRDSIGEVPPYDRDFFEGLFNACATVHKNGVYARAEFCAKQHVRDFLESGIHGQRVEFASLSSKRGLHRTQNLPFMEVPPQGNLESYFLGTLCGSEAVRDREGEIWAQVRPACKNVLDRLGVVYEETGKRLRINVFYIKLFLPELPDPVQGYWIRQLPKRGVEGTRKASLLAAMHWRLIFKRKKQYKYGLPNLIGASHAWNLGFGREAVDEEMAKLRFDHVDKRIRSRCERWAALQELERSEAAGDIKWIETNE